jgi:AAA+ superfamily predicted ATPase
MTDDRKKLSSKLPEWYPDWARELGELYFSGTTNMFTVHGNTHDLIRTNKGFQTLPNFVAEHLFGQWDVVLYYDLSTGLRIMAGSDGKRQQEMASLVSKRTGLDLRALGKDPTKVLHVLDALIQKNVMVDEGKRLSIAVIFNHASFIARRGDTNLKTSTHVVTLLNWATSPYIKRLNTAFVLIDSTLNDLNERIAGNPHIANLDVPLPDEKERMHYLERLVEGRTISDFSDFTVQQLATLTAGIGLTDLRVLVDGTIASGDRLNAARFQELKKDLIERQARGMLEFVEPKWGLDMVVGHEAAKQRLKDDASLLARGRLQAVPMGYLLCGPVGTGKSFLAKCAAGELGIPFVVLKNFRGGLVGQTESNLERILMVLRSMGPVVVFVDEADAQLGDRKSGGDSGVSGRVFGMIAQQMGDTRYRGKILWMLATTRPDYLPIDLKRQGRAEVHIPLFYPVSTDEIQTMFEVLARKLDAKLETDALPHVDEKHIGQLSGADIEGILGRAWRDTLVEGQDGITAETLQAALDGFIPMAQGHERRLQTLAAIIECTDKVFFTPQIRDLVAAEGGRDKVQERFNALKAVVDGAS